MGKKVIISSSVVALSFGLVLGLFSVGASATDEPNKIQPRTTENDGIMLINDECDETNNDCEDLVAPQDDYNSEVVITDDGDVEEIEEIEEEVEPAMWPVYVSFGALGVMVLMVIILNLTGKKKK